jgi:hypothetical protein
MSLDGSGHLRWPVSRTRTRFALTIRSTTSHRHRMAYSWFAMRMTVDKSGSAATRSLIEVPFEGSHSRFHSRPNSRACVRNLGPRLKGAGSEVVAVMNRAVNVAMVRVVAGGRLPLGSPSGVKGLTRTPVVSHKRPGRVVGVSAGHQDIWSARTRQSKACGGHDRCGSAALDCVHARTVSERLWDGTRSNQTAALCRDIDEALVLINPLQRRYRTGTSTKAPSSIHVGHSPSRVGEVQSVARRAQGVIRGRE